VKHWPHVVFGTLVSAVLSFLACIGFAMWQFNRPPFHLSNLERLHSGMTTNDVRKLLGAPRHAYIHTNETGQPFTTWSYSRRGSWSIVYIYFHSDGTFERHVYDR
jgi:hypothetical protein